MTARCGGICGCYRCVTWLLSGYGLPASRTTKSTGVVTFLFWRTARSVPCILAGKNWSPLRSRNRTKFQFIGEHQLAAPFCQLAVTCILHIAGHTVFFRPQEHLLPAAP